MVTVVIVSRSRDDSGCSRLSRPADRTARPEPERGRSLPGAVQNSADLPGAGVPHVS